MWGQPGTGSMPSDPNLQALCHVIAVQMVPWLCKRRWVERTHAQKPVMLMACSHLARLAGTSGGEDSDAGQAGTGLGPSPRGARLLRKLRAFMRQHVDPAEAVFEVCCQTCVAGWQHAALSYGFFMKPRKQAAMCIKGASAGI